jgi:hypothetical protein
MGPLRVGIAVCWPDLTKPLHRTAGQATVRGRPIVAADGLGVTARDRRMVASAPDERRTVLPRR